MKWDIKHLHCQNCGTTRRERRGGGLCTKCYPLLRKLQKVGAWDFSKIDEARKSGYPKASSFKNEEIFYKIKQGFIKQIKERLVELKFAERSLEKEVSGINIEHKFASIASLLKLKDKNLFFQSADAFDSNFTQGQKKIVFKHLNKLTENVPWCGIDWERIFFDRSF